MIGSVHVGFTVSRNLNVTELARVEIYDSVIVETAVDMKVKLLMMKKLMLMLIVLVMTFLMKSCLISL